MPGILFSFKDTLIELESAKAIAACFLENEEFAFAQIRTQLESLRANPVRDCVGWELSPQRALRTIVSGGEHAPNGKGISVIGTLSFLWEVKRVQPKKQRAPAEFFQLAGIASRVLRVFAINDNGSQGGELAMWRIEIGDDASPGCHFHVQIRGEANDGPFPKNLSVPRLPGCLLTPMAALEFMLSELFQERWKKHVFAETDALKRWRAIQRDRFLKLFAWQRETVSVGDRSPWSALKSAKPPERIFIT